MRSRLLRVASFFAIAGVVYVASLAAASRVRAGRYTLLQGFTRVYVEPGGQFQSLRRFREADARGHVDIVFLGASHTYRGFDPRLFAAAGLSTMNLGSTNQTPLNSRFVAERWLPSLTPRLVVVEVEHATLAGDGLESARDLLVNTSWSWGSERMAIETWNLGATSFATAKGLGLAGDESHAAQAEIPGETYVAGGYCETRTARSRLADGEPIRFHVAPGQLHHLAELTAFAQSRGAAVVWVTLPLPRDTLARLVDRAEASRTIAEAAARAGVPWWDFSDTLDLDPLADFYDVLHVNASGVAKLDRAFLAKLDSVGLLR